MPYSDYSYSMPYEGAAVAGSMILFLLLVYVILLGFLVVTYVLQSLGLYTIAKRRGIHHPWLSWLPVGNVWIVGIISDQYQYVAKGRVKNRRKVLLGLSIGMYAAMALYFIGAVGLAAATVVQLQSSGALAGTVMLLVLAALAMYTLAIIATVFQYIAFYDLYQSCDPGNAVLFLVLSIVFSVTMPFFVFACRKKDFGMPPRKPVQPEQPVFQPMPVQPAQPVAQPEGTPAEESTEETIE